MDAAKRWTKAAALILVLVPLALNAVTLWPEVSLPLPSLNDDAVHFLYIQRASQALANGENPTDHWLQELELGFPVFLYYQHLPHLVVVALHRLLLKQVDLLTLFNVVRYLLLVGFPLTVYWSMRRLGFSVVAGAVGAAASTLFVSNHAYGLEYGSYLWRGHGMYTQLWAVHLSLVTLACLYRVLERGTGYVAAVAATSALGLSHLVYAYMIAPAVIVLLLLGLDRNNARRRLVRLAITGGFALVVTSYLWLPFLLLKTYVNVSAYLPRWRYDSFGAGDVLTWLVNGDMLDRGRLPVLTVLLALGILWAVLVRTRPAQLALGLFVMWLALYFGRPTWGTLLDLLPMHEGLPLHRLVGGVHLAAILLIGLGGEWIWRQLAPLPGWSRPAAAALVLLALLAPALIERQQNYAQNTEWMEQTARALEGDTDARTVLSALRELPPGRTYAGLRTNWGKEMKVGGLYFWDLLTFDRIMMVGPPYGSISLNGDVLYHFDDQNPAHYNLFNARYVIAPRRRTMPPFLRPIKETARYILYSADSRGYAQFASVTETRSVGSPPGLLSENQTWMSGPGPAAGQFTRYEYGGANGRSRGAVNAAVPSATGQPGCVAGGAISEERFQPGRIDLRTACPEASTVVMKVAYHPLWRVTVDGREASPFMVSPSFIGVDVPAGAHQIGAEYRPPRYKDALLVLGLATMAGALVFRRRLPRLEAALCSTRQETHR